MVEGGATPVRPATELFQLGFRVVIYPGAMVRVVVKAAQNYLLTLHELGSTDSIRDRMLDFGELNDLLGTSDILADAKRYDPTEQ